MEFAIIEEREEILGGKSEFVRRANVCLPLVCAMHQDDIAVVGEGKIGLKEALPGFVVESKGLVGVRIIRVLDFAKGMSDVRALF